MTHPNQKRSTGSAPRKVRGPKLGGRPLSTLVPTNWCDPLLTGPASALPSVRAGKWNCRDIEALLRGIQDRIRAAEQPDQGAEK